jgi:hypothetical protein
VATQSSGKCSHVGFYLPEDLVNSLPGDGEQQVTLIRKSLSPFQILLDHVYGALINEHYSSPVNRFAIIGGKPTFSNGEY